jgi:hypothetical protein
MFISAVNFFWRSDEHRLQAIVFPQSETCFVFCEEGALFLQINVGKLLSGIRMAK